MTFSSLTIRSICAVAAFAGLLEIVPAQDRAARAGASSGAPTLLPTGWPIRPGGRQLELGAMPQDAALSPNGRFLLVLNGGEPASISVLDAAELAELSRVPVDTAGMGLVFASSGAQVYVAGGRGNAVYEYNFSTEGELTLSKAMLAQPGARPGGYEFIGDVAIPPNGRLIYATDVFHDQVLVFNPQSGEVIGSFATGRRPHSILFHPDGEALYVSSWADATILQHETRNGRELSRIRVAPHPTGMVLSDREIPDEAADSAAATRYRLFVTAANTNNVLTVNIDADRIMTNGDVLNIGFAPGMPAGMTPLALALSPDQTLLYVACADANVVAVADIYEMRTRLAGFLPAGAYPAALETMDDGRLVVLNAHGMGEGPGSASIFDSITPENIGPLTDQALELVPYRGSVLPTAEPELPVENVIYILTDGVAEGATAPNYAKLSQEFASFPLLGGATEFPSIGKHFLLAGIAPNFTRLLAPKYRDAAVVFPDFDAAEPANTPPAGYLWTNALSARKTVRNYGVFTANTANSVRVKEPRLAEVTNMTFRAPGPAASDTQRAQVFLNDFAQFVESGEIPDLMMVRLAGGADPDTAADHDAAIGQIVEAVSGSRLWPTSAIVVAPATGSGPVHLISAYTRNPSAGASPASQASALRTVERILGLRPITLYDASVPDLTSTFGAFVPDPFVAE